MAASRVGAVAAVDPAASVLRRDPSFVVHGGVPVTETAHKAVNVIEFEAIARAVIPPMSFDFVAGGSEDETTLAGNRAGFDQWRIVPRALSGVDSPSLATTVLGDQISMPVMVSPMGLHKLMHPDGEAASAAGTQRAGTIYTAAIAASMALEEVAAAAGLWWFQLYLLVDRGLSLEIVRRAELAGASAIVLTVDVPVRGRREADERNGFEIPSGITMPNLLPRDHAGGDVSYFVLTAWDKAITWKDVEWLAANTSLPIIVKGLLSAADAHLAVEHGAKGVIVSNHGGRQLDSAVSSIDALPAIADRVGERAEVFLDGGVRRGTDVLKALALGARAVMVGRPVLFSLAAGGEEGVVHMFDLLRHELTIDMILAGVGDVRDVSRELIVRNGPIL